MSRKIIEPAIQNLIDVNGWMIKWKPKNLARALDLPIGMLYSARQSKWFERNSSWNVCLFYYYVVDNKSRRVWHCDDLIIHPSLDPSFTAINELLYKDTITKNKEYMSTSIVIL